MPERAYFSKAPTLALAGAAFGIGTTEFVIMGLLPQVAADLRVGLPAAGLLVSGYALGVAFGGPVLAALLHNVPARATLIGLMGLFVAGNLGCAVAPSYALLMLARIVTAFSHAAFFGTGAVVAARLAPPGRSAQAIALMISGLTVANIIGVPLGTFIGQAAGWRMTFLAVAGIGMLALLGMARLLPSIETVRDLGAEVRTLRAPQVWLTLTVSMLAATSMFSFFTYVTAILTQVAGVAASHVGLVLLATGAGLTAGNYIRARLADWRAGSSLVVVLIGVALVLLGFAALGRTQWAATAIVTAWGVCAFAVCAITQAMVVEADRLRAAGPRARRRGRDAARDRREARGQRRQVAIAWLLGQDGVAAIPKAQRPESQEANLAAAAIRLDNADRQAIAALPKDLR